MTLIDKLDRVEYLLKHLPGRHNQQRHAGERAVYGGIEYTPREPKSTIVSGYSDAAVERVADYIRNRQGQPPEYAHELLDKVVLGDKNLGEWANDALATIRTERLIESSEGILDRQDLDKLRSFDARIWNTDRELRVASDKRMGGADPLSVESEYGLSRYAMRPDVAPVGKWDFRNGKFVITVNASAEEKYGLTKRHVFWHEFGHTITEDQINNKLGAPIAGESAGEYMDRFAIEMSGGR